LRVSTLGCFEANRFLVCALGVRQGESGEQAPPYHCKNCENRAKQGSVFAFSEQRKRFSE